VLTEGTGLGASA